MAFNQSKLALISEEEEEVDVRNEGSQSCVNPCCLRNDLIHLPQEIILNILSRLPAESVLQCRIVCKTWKNLPILVNNTYFADMHLRHQPRQFQLDYENHQHHNNHYNFETETKMSFVFLGRNHSLYFVEYDENNEQSYRTHKRMSLPLPDDSFSVVGSCNGLVCLSVGLKRVPSDPATLYNPAYICNPITREFVPLPRFNFDIRYGTGTAYGFGYHPSTNEYKVVRIYYPRYFSRGHVQIYTLGSGVGWRSKGEITHTLSRIKPGVHLNGALHWTSLEKNIVAFDLADEEFRCLPKPPFCITQSCLWVLGGCLSLLIPNGFVSADIWLLKKKEKQNMSSGDDDTKEQVYQSWSWSREFAINICCSAESIQPFGVTKAGEILLWQRGQTVVCCDPKTTAPPKILGNLDMGLLGTPYYPFLFLRARGTSHVNSFVSLKSLGENAEIQ